jgi:hypothetical protein
MAANVLVCSIARETLRGVVDGKNFIMRAWSGGARGRTKGATEFSHASYDVFRKENEAKGIRGGPIPPGIYICRYVKSHAKFGECIFLQQTILSLFQVDADANIRFYDRAGFFIHGRGPRGSDGCIVPAEKDARLALNTAIKDAKSPVMLQVVEQGMPLPAAIERKSAIA